MHSHGVCIGGRLLCCDVSRAPGVGRRESDCIHYGIDKMLSARMNEMGGRLAPVAIARLAENEVA